MFQIIAFFGIALTILQLIPLLFFGYIPNYAYWQNPNWLQFFLVFFINLSLFTFFFFSFKFEKKLLNKVIEIKLAKLRVFFLIIIYFLLYYYAINLMNNFTKSDMLFRMQGQEGLGIFFRISTVIFPSFTALMIVYFKQYKLFSFFILISSFYLAYISSQAIQAKGPLVSFCLLIIFLYRFRYINRIFLFISITSIIFSLSYIYLLRGHDEFNYAPNIILAILYRFVSSIESVVVFDYILRLNLEFDNINHLGRQITSYIFDRNPSHVGIAPSLLGFFWAAFGIFGTIFAFLLVYIFKRLILIMLSDGPFIEIRFFLYFIWFFETLSFFTDGNPLFYTGTEGNKMFWLLVIVSIPFAFIYLFRKKIVFYKTHT